MELVMKHLLELVEEINLIEREINKEWTCKKEQQNY